MTNGRLQISPKYFWMLVGLLVSSIMAYVFFIQGSIYYSLSTNALSSLLQTQESELAVLESNYYKASEGVDITLAHRLGFIDSEHTLFVSFNTSGDLVGYANERAR